MNKDEIKANRSLKDVLRSYGVDIRNGRCRCFIHDGHDRNMSIFRNNAHCFVCGANVDVFKAVMHFENCTFKEALEKLGGVAQTAKAKQMARLDVIKQTQYELASKQYDKALSLYCAADWLRIYYTQTRDPRAHGLFEHVMQNWSRYEQNLEEKEAVLYGLRLRE